MCTHFSATQIFIDLSPIVLTVDIDIEMDFEDILVIMNQTGYGKSMPPPRPGFSTAQLTAQNALLDTVFPGFSLLSSAIYRHTAVDISIYIPIFLGFGVFVFCCRYLSAWFWTMLESYMMSVCDVRIDDEMYNMVMGWVAEQRFARNSRRFVANTNLNSRAWLLWRTFEEENEEQDDDVTFDEEGNAITVATKNRRKKNVRFTPSFGSHYFWYKGQLLLFKRTQNTRNLAFGPVSEQEEISICSFGRNPAVLKALLDECRESFIKNDENHTVIYRGGLKPGTSEPSWTRCVSRVSRPFSTVVLDDQVKQSLLDDMRDYLHPYTRRWYSNRGIPYRRGYLLYGPPGTGKSSLSFALAGYFKLKIYIVSLNNPAMNEENLGNLFTELPKQCVVLLEDIDTAGLTHTRDAPEANKVVEAAPTTNVTNPAAPAVTPPTGGRISLSALLNILDGVASQEGRVLIMTTNHIEKLDDALIRPGRVDMMVEFDLANTSMIQTIFHNIYATLEGDVPQTLSEKIIRGPKKAITLSKSAQAVEDERVRREEEIAEKAEAAKRKTEEEKVKRLAEEIAKKIPTMTFSPAEVQGYLLKHKRAPEVAVREAEAWAKKTLEDKVKEKLKKEKEAKEQAEKEAKEKKEEEEKKKLEEKKELTNSVKDNEKSDS